jgi:hypothetical protein
MTAVPHHAEVEAAFRALLCDADLPPPDSVRYEPRSVLFSWHEPRLAVVVDLDESLPAPASGSSPWSRARTPGGA